MKLKESYEKIHPEVEIEISETDSSTGIRSTIEGICDIGMVSREIRKSEKDQGLWEIMIAMDGLVVIVNHECPIEELTVEQVRNIYTGKIVSWKQVIRYE